MSEFTSDSENMQMRKFLVRFGDFRTGTKSRLDLWKVGSKIVSARYVVCVDMSVDRVGKVQVQISDDFGIASGGYVHRIWTG